MVLGGIVVDFRCRICDVCVGQLWVSVLVSFGFLCYLNWFDRFEGDSDEA
jgi:hypothetical protein